MNFTGNDLTHLNEKIVTFRQEARNNKLPFSEKIPERISANFEYHAPFEQDIKIGDYFNVGPKDFMGNGSISIEKTLSALDGETTVYQVTSDDYGHHGSSIYGEIDTKDSEKWIGHFELVDQEEGNIREACRRFRENGVAEPKYDYPGLR